MRLHRSSDRPVCGLRVVVDILEDEMTADVRNTAIAAIALLVAGSAGIATAQQSGMSFFVTSAGSGKGADFGGLDGADKHCQALAAAVGAGAKKWHAYLSTQAAGPARGQRARPHRQGSVAEREGRGDREGRRRAARDQQPQQADGPDRKGRRVPDAATPPNQHDILTGTQPDGTAFAAATTRPAATGRRAATAAPSSAITTARDSTRARRRCRGIRRTRRAGCSDALLKKTGGAG